MFAMVMICAEMMSGFAALYPTYEQLVLQKKQKPRLFIKTGLAFFRI
jgi:hypothetical protein